MHRGQPANVLRPGDSWHLEMEGFHGGDDHGDVYMGGSDLSGTEKVQRAKERGESVLNSRQVFYVGGES